MIDEGWVKQMLWKRLVLTLFCCLPVVLQARAFESRVESLDDEKLKALAAEALSEGELDKAALAFTELAARGPRDPSIQTLLGLTYHRSAKDNPESLGLAEAGYDLALSAQPASFWASALAGRAAFERGEFDVATSRYAQAVLARPRDGRAMLALASSAYMAGDVELAVAAAEKSTHLNANSHTHAASLRMAVLAGMAGGYTSQAQAHLVNLQAIDTEDASTTAVRADEIAQTNPVDVSTDPDPETNTDPGASDQISVDVAIVLAQRSKRDRAGLNLMDGLTLNYGYGRNYGENRSKSQGNDSTYNAQRSITRAITVPELNYNLNLFNRTGQYYSVVARPSLTAYRGETSEFFVGRTLKVGISGVNFSSLESIDIGIELKVTPLEITRENTRVRVETTRSFMTEGAAGTFREGLATFRQKVAATAEVGFGETLILSGLSESVDDSTYSKTPLIGDLPIVGSAFNERSKQSRRDAAIMLVTPSLPGSLPGRAQIRSESVDKLVKLWTRVIDPATNATDIGARLSRIRLFTRAQPNDAPLVWPSPGEQSVEALRELLLPAYD